jgi:hypothetical protein
MRATGVATRLKVQGAVVQGAVARWMTGSASGMPFLFSITEGDPHHTIGGVPVACEGHKTRLPGDVDIDPDDIFPFLTQPAGRPVQYPNHC